MPTVTLPDHELAYASRGEGEPVLLLGGSGEPMLAWELSGLIDALVESGRRVVWYAARGVRPSGCPPLPWSIDDLADDAVALLDHLGIERCTAIGYSLGGFTAEALARRAPDRLSRAVLMGSAGEAGTIRDAFIAAENSLADRYGEVPVEFSRLMTLITVLGGPELLDEGTVSQWWELLAHQQDQWAVPHGEVGQSQAAASWRAAGSTTGLPWPRAVGVGMLFFEHDCLFPPAVADRLAAHLGADAVEVVDGAGHGGLMTRSESTVAALLRLVSPPE